MNSYPSWAYYPNNTAAPAWVVELTEAITLHEGRLDTESASNPPLKSDDVLALLRPNLERLGFIVEAGKGMHQKIRRPVLFGENGSPRVSYEIDAFHIERRVAVEVEAGRGAANNADYRDIVRTSLLLDVDYLVLLMPKKYRHGVKKVIAVEAYKNTRNQLDAIYASRRLQLPFAGVLLVGY